ncbi:MAG TPA: acyl-CoA thioesterase [Candidatus Polarisedimenticolia bacterium]|nr:acyl-CoA thioesterase [Candidatus Polarisedimenticolia bacterium]
MPKQRRKQADESRVEMTEIILPEDTNQYGNVWGGRIMALIDKAAAIAAIRHSRSNVVTASVDSLVFRAPVRLSHILRLYASVNAAFGSSMEVGVKVLSEDPLTGDRAHCCSAYVTMVSLDAGGRPAGVPGLQTSTPADRRRQRDAQARRRSRLTTPRNREYPAARPRRRRPAAS